MDLSKRKYEFIEKVITVNEPVFEKLESLLNDELSGSKRVSIEDYNQKLEEANERIEKGEFYTQKEVERIASKW